MIGVKTKQKTENSEAGLIGGKTPLPPKKAAYTQGIYFYTHLYTHLDIVHVKIYAIHTPASCQVPRTGGGSAGGHGCADGHLYTLRSMCICTHTYTPPPALGDWTQAWPRTDNLLEATMSPKSAIGRRQKESSWSLECGNVASPYFAQDQHFAHQLRGESCPTTPRPGESQRRAARLCARVQACMST